MKNQTCAQGSGTKNLRNWSPSVGLMADKGVIEIYKGWANLGNKSQKTIKNL